MYRSAVAFVAVAVPATLTLAAPVPTHLMPPPFFHLPTAVGDEWMYHHSAAASDGRDTTARVARVEVTDRGRVVTVEAEEGNGERVPFEKVLLIEHGQFLSERGGSAFDPPVCDLKLPPRPGAEWEATSVFCGAKFRFKFKVLEPEWVRTQAGRFRAVPVIEDMRCVGGGAEMWPTTRWFAPGVRCVKAITDGGVNDFLRSFGPNKK